MAIVKQCNLCGGLLPLQERNKIGPTYPMTKEKWRHELAARFASQIYLATQLTAVYAGLKANSKDDVLEIILKISGNIQKDVPGEAYELADAMLKEGDKK